MGAFRSLRSVVGRLVVALIVSAFSLGSVTASEKTFFALMQTCYFAGGQVWASTQKEVFYNEAVGSLVGSNGQLCIRGILGTRFCRAVVLHNFQMACHDGLATAPQLYMALFGNDQSTKDNGFALNGNQLSYSDPGFTQAQRVYYPPGYAPFDKAQFDSLVKRLTWDDFNQRLLLTHSVNSDQERRIRALFNTRGGYVEPFPASSIQRAVEISEERPLPPTPAPSPSPVLSNTSVQQTYPPADSPSSVNGLRLETNSNLAIGAGVIFVAFLSWVFGTISKILSGERPHILRQIGVESASLVISGFILYSFGIVDEVKLLSIPLVGGLSIAVVSTIKSA